MSLSLWQALVKNRKNDTLLCLKWTANTDLLYSTWNSDQCYVTGWTGGEFVEGWYKRLSPFTVHQKRSQHC